MTYRKKKSIAIITARGGSKRIPRKNIKEFMGKPMIAYAIEVAQESEIFDEIMVSTDDIEIAEIAKQYGANIPFMRSRETANDFATTAVVLNEVINEYQKLGKSFESFCCIYPCVPFLTAETLKLAYEKFKKTKADSLTPIVKFSFPIQRAYTINENNYIDFREPENKNKRSQDLQPMFHDAGMFYFYNTKKFLNNSCIKQSYIELEESITQDIDNQSDWDMAELKYRILHKL